MKKITILGSTGSIGVSTLDVIEKNPKAFKVTALAAGRNVKLLAEQIIKYKPEIASVSTREDAEKLRQILGRRKKIPILYDETGVEEVASYPSSDMVVSAISGAAGLKPTLAAIEVGRDVALANKETMVIAGDIVTRRAKKKKIKILPVDSEHSAIGAIFEKDYSDGIRRSVLSPVP
jgi:1-deoxy-D-xylulose-5-phosphate reductoisomerase